MVAYLFRDGRGEDHPVGRQLEHQTSGQRRPGRACDREPHPHDIDGVFHTHGERLHVPRGGGAGGDPRVLDCDDRAGYGYLSELDAAPDTP